MQALPDRGANVPAAQGLHKVAPGWEEKPASQGVHGVFKARLDDPAAQGKQMPAHMADVVPGLQAVHLREGGVSMLKLTIGGAMQSGAYTL